MPATGCSIRHEAASERNVSKGKTVPCPHCQTPLDRQRLRASESLTCSGCGKTIRPSSRGRKNDSSGTSDSHDVSPAAGFLTVRCTECNRRFGIKLKYAGKPVTCPHCKSTRAYESAEPGSEALPEEPAAPEVAAPVIPEAAAAKKVDVSRDIESHVSPESKEILSAELDLLPPRFLVPRSVALAAGLDESAADPTSVPIAQVKKNPEFAVNQSILHIRRGGDVVAVVPVSREAREARKRIRVLLIWLLAVAIFALLFWILKDPGDADSLPEQDAELRSTPDSADALLQKSHRC
jgi:ribosomal protein S27E